MNNLFLIRGFLFILVGMAIFMRSTPSLAANLEDTYTRLNPPKLIQPFKLTDGKNQNFTQTNLQNHWSLMFFGFTRCQYICPTTMTAVAHAYNLLQKQDHLVPQVLFISIDPSNDTPERVGKYAMSFQPNFIGLTGQEKTIKQLTHELGVLYMKVKQNNNDTIDHSANLFLVNPKGEVAVVFTPPYEPKQLATVLGQLIR